MFRVRKVVKYLHVSESKFSAAILEWNLFFDTTLCENWFDTLFKRPLFKSYSQTYKFPRTDWGRRCEKNRHQ